LLYLKLLVSIRGRDSQKKKKNLYVDLLDPMVRAILLPVRDEKNLPIVRIPFFLVHAAV
jgi:hypothetical protein